jgi:ketosteroid isomerase-like protein
MPEESTTPGLVRLARQAIGAVRRRDVDAILSLAAPDLVWDMSPMGLGVYEGREAIRGFGKDWIGAYDELEIGVEELPYLGNRVAFAVLTQKGRPAGSSGYVQARAAHVLDWVAGVIARVTVYPDIDEGRAAAERLAESRG